MITEGQSVCDSKRQGILPCPGCRAWRERSGQERREEEWPSFEHLSPSAHAQEGLYTGSAALWVESAISFQTMKGWRWFFVDPALLPTLAWLSFPLCCSAVPVCLDNRLSCVKLQTRVAALESSLPDGIENPTGEMTQATMCWRCCGLSVWKVLQYQMHFSIWYQFLWFGLVAS